MDSILEDGDSVIIEAPTYSGTLSYLKARDIRILSVDMDSDGMIPEKLEELLLSTKSDRSVQELYGRSHVLRKWPK